MSNLDNQIAEAKSILKQLKEIKGHMREDLNKIKVQVDSSDGPITARAIEKVFGEMDNNDPRKGFITFDMYMQCQRIIVAAGQAKAESELRKGYS